MATVQMLLEMRMPSGYGRLYRNPTKSLAQHVGAGHIPGDRLYMSQNGGNSSQFMMSELCERLDREVSFLDRSQGKKVTCLVAESQGYAIAEKIVYHQTRLLFNRHFDQVLLAIVYGVCKVNKLSVQFKDIVSHFTKQPQGMQEVYRGGSPRGPASFREGPALPLPGTACTCAEVRARW